MTTDHADDLNLIDQGTRAAREILQRRIDELETARDEQPERLATALRDRDAARDDTLIAQPWVDTLSAIPGVDETGALTGMLALPSLATKEVWAARLALDMAAMPTVDRYDVISDYFGHLNGDTDLALVVFSAALVSMADLAVDPLLDALEAESSNYEARVGIANAARKAWTARLTDDHDIVGMEAEQ